MSPVNSIQYFLGANSPTGFYSLYDQLLPPEQASAIYILKGGPGCGKSTLMRRVAALAQEAGENVVSGQVRSATYKGHTTRLEVSGCFQEPVYPAISEYAECQEGDTVLLYFPPERICVYKSTMEDE